MEVQFRYIIELDISNNNLVNDEFINEFENIKNTEIFFKKIKSLNLSKT